MPTQSPTGIGGRPRLNPARVLEAALEIADKEGIEALTMRRLGKRLGVEAMSLYNHVAGKEGLLDGIVDLVIAEIELPPSGVSWDTAVRTCAVSAYRTMLRHPWSCQLVMHPPAGTARSSRMRYIESLLRTFTDAGFSPELTYRAYHAIDSHVLGFSMWEVGHNVADVTPELIEQMMALVSTGEYPYLLMHAQQHMSQDNQISDEFEFGLDLILQGLRRMHLAERRPLVRGKGAGDDRSTVRR